MNASNFSTDDRPLNAALREAVDFVHAEGWDRPATLFALVPAELVQDVLASGDNDAPEDGAPEAPLALVVQDDLPDHILPGSDELGEYISTVRWPDVVVGAVLAQEIVFRNSAEDSAASDPRQARLFTGVIDDGPDRTLLQLRPSEADLADDPFAEDKVELLGGLEGSELAPGVTAMLRYTFED
ncbi:MAG: PPA1309 family protein [Mycobacteriaceae bacterium]|uniref:PPA1309 family protein n=1 Tax=Corynebacterium sp. TaxID=1720 RepID=UPI003F969158